MEHNTCNKEREIDWLREDVKEIKKDVKALVAFRWQIFGAVGAIAIIITTLFQAFSLAVK